MSAVNVDYLELLLAKLMIHFGMMENIKNGNGRLN